MRRVLVTHVHRDHYSQALTLRRESAPTSPSAPASGIFALVHEPGATVNSRHIAGCARPGRQTWAAQVAAQFGARGFDLEAGSTRTSGWRPGRSHLPGGRELTAVETPGHTRGHLVFHDARPGCCFAATTCAAHTRRSRSSPSRIAAVAAFLDSLRLVRPAAGRGAAPAHGAGRAERHARSTSCSPIMTCGSREALERAVGIGQHGLRGRARAAVDPARPLAGRARRHQRRCSPVLETARTWSCSRPRAGSSGRADGVANYTAGCRSGPAPDRSGRLMWYAQGPDRHAYEHPRAASRTSRPLRSTPRSRPARSPTPGSRSPTSTAYFCARHARLRRLSMADYLGLRVSATSTPPRPAARPMSATSGTRRPRSPPASAGAR